MTPACRLLTRDLARINIMGRSLFLKLAMLTASMAVTSGFWPTIRDNPGNPNLFIQDPDQVLRGRAQTHDVTQDKVGGGLRGASQFTPSPQDPSPLESRINKHFDINASSLAELITLPGIGKVLAQRIIRHRTEQGRFHSIEELKNVKGIGEGRLSRLGPMIVAGATSQQNP